MRLHALKEPRSYRSILAALLLLLGCGGDGSGPAGPKPDPVENATLGVSTASAVGRVDVAGLPSPSGKLEIGELVAIFSATGADDFTLILDHDEEGWFFFAPLHSVTPLVGGEFSVVISDGEVQSSAQPLTVGTLPEAPGAFAGMVSALTEWTELVASTAGTSIAELRVMDPASMDPGLLLLRLAQAYLDSDEDERDLTDAVANTNDFLSAEQLELLDRIFGHAGLEEQLRLLIDELEPDPAAIANINAKRGADGCIDPDLAINGAGELSVRMLDSAVTEFATDPEGRPAQLNQASGEIMSVLSNAPGPAGVVAAISAGGFAALGGSMGYLAGTRPTRFTSISCDIDRTVFNEDFEYSAVYSNIWVTAVADGFTADRSLANALINVLGGTLSAAGRLQIAESEILGNAASFELGVGVDLVFGETDLITFCPQTWEIDITNAPFQTAGVENRRFDVNPLLRTVTPLETGVDVLTVAVQAPLFGGRTISKQIPIEVKKIEVSVFPTTVCVINPGFPINIEATIANADDPRLSWMPEHGNWVDGLEDITQGGAARTLSTPSDVDFYPFEVRIESLSRGGLRESGVPARFATVTFELCSDPLVIGPGFACVPNGATEQFAILGEVGEIPEVTWEVTEGGGSIDANGLYVAPTSGDGSATIRATSVEDPSRVGYVTVDVASCDCWLDINISGDSSWVQEGDQIAYWVSENEVGPFYQVNIYETSASGQSISASIWGGQFGPHLRPGDSGEFAAGFSYSTPDQSWNTLEIDSGSVIVDKLTESYMVGSFVGTAVIYDNELNVVSRVDFDVAFRALRYSLQESYPCD